MSGFMTKNEDEFFAADIYFYSQIKTIVISIRVQAIAQLVEALRYKPEARGFDSRWCH
jgi:hypothetical protein